MDPLLIATRALHFVGALSLVGICGFAAFIARDPPRQLARQLRVAAQLSAALLLTTAPLWLILVGRNMSADTLAATLTGGIPKTVLLQTQFGHALGVHFVLTLFVLPLIAWLGQGRVLDRLAVLVAAAGLATIAWQGHAGAELGRQALIHLPIDVVHLIAAGLWLGALLPLLLLLRGTSETSLQYDAAKRFSTLGVICVAALLPSGIVNTYYLVGSVRALIGTAYGQILLLKVALVLMMLGLAAVNRWQLVPRLTTPDDGYAAQRIIRHAAIETGLGLGVIAIVAALGTIPPAMHGPIVWPFGSAPEIHPSPAMPAGHVHEN